MNNFKSFALIPAAGMGKRMGASTNKQYLQLAGLPILTRTLTIFEQSDKIDGIILIIPEDEIPYCRKKVVEAAGFKKVLEIVAGGRERQNSVMNGLIALGRYADSDDIVVIHDGVRPFITPVILSDSINVAVDSDGALAAVPAKDTIKIAENNIVTSTPDRRLLWQAQTPQTFRYSVILDAHKNALQNGFCGTDDSSLVERVGGKVVIINGDYRNIKITTPEDMLLAEAFLAADIDQEVEVNG
ncbi:MAG: 2-C-methyl-D-erythritol 4-phosphate cytidylyltransferase [Geobacteraceae bacterium GWC2_48_7]|nr:MAG: 2-C-methyl-D-erythritol 4-phosphate cytidylyltransferase [Geobacteraceae bacterium GWC2_48_7]